LNRICHQSGVGALIDAASIPISEDARLEADPLGSAINEGEDFELLFTVGTEPWDKLRTVWDDPVPITKIGTITDTGRLQILMPNGRTTNLEPHGYEHLERRT
jgi:thiamine-monophosphate kinase